MENWQLALIILGAVLVGSLAHVFLMLALTLTKAGNQITILGQQLSPALKQVQVIADRVEVLSRGLEGGDKRVAELLDALGTLSQGIERNMKLLNVSASIAAAVVPAISAFVQTMRKPADAEEERCHCGHSHKDGSEGHNAAAQS